ncbi:dnaJ homolog subfamily C member 27 isoform X2 [Nematostella vectensis]|uniref:dnaJ homolog subfamily C member 27 isoform X2 n=1 Tax=Nematostella vectensis TaxID=45351 RepID=UPI0013906523|nr:dnaJ homolog subfamily C member 27 isoform X2 [Nematostella vectensis]
MATEKSVEKRKPTREGEYKKVVGIGNDGVGKTCLVKNFCEKKFSKSYHQTVGVDYGFKLHKIHGVEYRINFWDFGGDPDYNEIRSELYGQTQACMLVYDVTNRMSFESLKDWLNEFSSNGGKNAVVAVVANKIDLISRRVISSKEGQKWARAQDLKYYETSSANGQGVYEMFNDLLVTVIDRKLLRAKPVVTLDKDGKMK